LNTGQKREGFWGGVVLGVSLGLIWTPCVGPILASVLTLAATSQITSQLILITLAFALGTAVPMLAIAYGGKHVLNTLPVLRSRLEIIQKIFGILIIATALLILFNIDRKFQTYILTVFPSYGEGLTKFENNEVVLREIDALKKQEPVELFKDDGQPAPNPEFEGASKWVNSEPLSLTKELKGKVVLVDFWTYTCINCIRTFPHVTSWYENYKDDGFVVVGVHTPEFEFERDTQNVLQAMKEYGIEYPVVQDNDYFIWQTYNNRYWPAHYLIDRKGNIRYTHFGEGSYDETEHMIRTLLAEGGEVTSEEVELGDQALAESRTPESYLGYNRIDRLSSTREIVEDAPALYSLPPSLPLHHLAFGGTWNVGEENAESSKGASLQLNFEGKDVFLVMRPAKEGEAAMVEILLDGKKIPVQLSGSDVENGRVTVDKDRLYKLIKLPRTEEHILLLKFIDKPVQVFAFTFG
jgi:thiol-disulfide isomerase/thioredoxin